MGCHLHCMSLVGSLEKKRGEREMGRTVKGWEGGKRDIEGDGGEKRGERHV